MVLHKVFSIFTRCAFNRSPSYFSFKNHGKVSRGTLERIKKKHFDRKTRRQVFVVVVRLRGMVEFACRECAGCEWPSRSLDKDTLLQLICTLCCYLKRDIWKTADCCDKGGYDSSFSLPFLPSFASISPAHSVSLSSFSVSLSTFSFLFFPFLFSFCFFLCSFYLPIRSSALPISSAGDDCPRHLCSVSQMSHNRT